MSQIDRQLVVQAIDVELDGKVEGCYLCVVEKVLSCEQLRSAAVHSFSPIHSYLFGQDGQLLYANPKASAHIMSKGGRLLAQMLVKFCNFHDQSTSDALLGHCLAGHGIARPLNMQSNSGRDWHAVDPAGA